MQIGIIGNGTHSKRIQKILRYKKKNFFLYKPSKNNYYDKYDFENLKKCKLIFIITPNQSHYSYIKKLYKNRYIFCEKPPVTSKMQLRELKKIRTGKLYFNYNYRHSKFASILKSLKKYNLGKLLYGNIINSQGFALKKEYKNNWRSNKKLCPKGIFEIVNIHYIDLINYFFHIKRVSKPKKINHSNIGNSFDTDMTEIELSKNNFINIFSTYYSALMNKIILIFENGIIDKNNNKIVIYGPALNLDRFGFFKRPKIKKIFKINNKSDYLISLEKSIKYFLSHATKNKKFSKKEFFKSIESNNLIL